MKKFENIISWQKGRELCSLIYSITNSGNFSTYFELRNQIRRASVSIISNIAEGFKRQSNMELNHLFEQEKMNLFLIFNIVLSALNFKTLRLLSL